MICVVPALLSRRLVVYPVDGLELGAVEDAVAVEVMELEERFWRYKERVNRYLRVLQGMFATLTEVEPGYQIRARRDRYIRIRLTVGRR